MHTGFCIHSFLKIRRCHDPRCSHCVLICPSDMLGTNGGLSNTNRVNSTPKHDRHSFGYYMTLTDTLPQPHNAALDAFLCFHTASDADRTCSVSATDFLNHVVQSSILLTRNVFETFTRFWTRHNTANHLAEGFNTFTRISWKSETIAKKKGTVLPCAYEWLCFARNLEISFMREDYVVSLKKGCTSSSSSKKELKLHYRFLHLKANPPKARVMFNVSWNARRPL